MSVTALVQVHAAPSGLSQHYVRLESDVARNRRIPFRRRRNATRSHKP